MNDANSGLNVAPPELLALIEEFPYGVTITKEEPRNDFTGAWKFTSGVFVVYAQTLEELFPEVSRAIVRTGINTVQQWAQQKASA